MSVALEAGQQSLHPQVCRISLQKGSTERPAEPHKGGNQVLQGGQRRPDADLGENSRETATGPNTPKQQRQAPDAPVVDGRADISASRNFISTATHLTDIPEGARAHPHTAGAHATAGPGSGVADDGGAPSQPTAVPVLRTGDVSERVPGVSAPVHFTDGSEATSATARELALQV